jgi:hypothetical protein
MRHYCKYLSLVAAFLLLCFMISAPLVRATTPHSICTPNSACDTSSHNNQPVRPPGDQCGRQSFGGCDYGCNYCYDSTGVQHGSFCAYNESAGDCEDDQTPMACGAQYIGSCAPDPSPSVYCQCFTSPGDQTGDPFACSSVPQCR